MPEDKGRADRSWGLQCVDVLGICDVDDLDLLASGVREVMNGDGCCTRRHKGIGKASRREAGAVIRKRVRLCCFVAFILLSSSAL